MKRLLDWLEANQRRVELWLMCAFYGGLLVVAALIHVWKGPA